jgi:hypothetical protein
MGAFHVVVEMLFHIVYRYRKLFRSWKWSVFVDRYAVEANDKVTWNETHSVKFQNMIHLSANARYEQQKSRKSTINKIHQLCTCYPDRFLPTTPKWKVSIGAIRNHPQPPSSKPP